MKTIFITSFHPLISRNILSTPLLKILTTNHNIRVVIFVPEYKKEFFEKEFGRPNIIVEGTPIKLKRRDTSLRYLALAALDTVTLRIKRKTEMRGSGEWASRILAKSDITRKFLLNLDRAFAPRGRFHAFFERYSPSLIFSTDIQNENDVRLLHEAKDRGIKTISMVRSWDNLTSKGIIRVIPDILLVNNEVIKNEALRYNKFPEERIRVIGIPHYDFYVTESCAPRRAFYEKTGLDPKKRFVLFAPTGDRYLSQNTVDRDVLSFLQEIVPLTHQILVRFPPADTVNLEGYLRRPHVIFDRPGRHFSGKTFKDTELGREDDLHLADSIYWSDLIIAGPSTLSIDAAVFDKPVILIGFDGSKERPYYDSIRRYFDYNHQRPIIESGGVRLVKTLDELKECVGRYLADPTHDGEGRKRIVKEQCWKLDGRATERLAAIISSIL